MANPESVNYSLFRARDTDEMSRLLGDVFAHRDPPAVAVGLTAPEFEVFARLLCAKAEVDGLTLVARSAATGQMIGALLAEDSASTPPDALDQLGFVERVKRSYEDHRFEGRAVFTSIADHGGPILMDRALVP